LENALRYTEPGGKVEVNVVPDSSDVKITVSDTGIGIPEENLPFIFDRFYRVDKSRSRTSGGSGLGLSITRAIVEAHNGNIEVKSKPGVGTQFIINLPLISHG
jgi:signal transduction histidine kinase